MNLQKIDDQLTAMNYYERQVFVFLLIDSLEQQAQINRRIAGAISKQLFPLSNSTRQ